jgi:hypothetical protein
MEGKGKEAKRRKRRRDGPGGCEERERRDQSLAACRLGRLSVNTARAVAENRQRSQGREEETAPRQLNVVRFTKDADSQATEADAIELNDEASCATVIARLTFSGSAFHGGNGKEGGAVVSCEERERSVLHLVEECDIQGPRKKGTHRLESDLPAYHLPEPAFRTLSAPFLRR